MPFFRLIVMGFLSHTREDILSWSVLVVSFLFLEMHLVTCLSCNKLKEKKRNHSLKQMTYFPFDTIFYLSKNYLTRSPSWDEHISFSRVSWPTSRHQVNTLFQFSYSNGANWSSDLLNGSGLKFILQESLAQGCFNCLMYCISDT